MKTKEPFLIDRNAVATDMQRLIETATRSKTAQLRRVIDLVEGALQEGVGRADVLAALQARGIDMTMNTFNASLARIRKARSPAIPLASRPRHPAITPPGTAPELHTGPPAASHDPQLGTTLPLGSSDPRALTDILKTVPDLDYFSQLGKPKKKHKPATT